MLVVDDEPMVRKMLRRHLQEQGYQVWTAEGGEEAVSLFELHGEQIAMVLLDIRTREMDGPRTMDLLRECNPDLPVCMPGRDSGEHERPDLFARGARPMVPKAINLKKITQLVRRHAGVPQSAGAANRR